MTKVTKIGAFNNHTSTNTLGSRSSTNLPCGRDRLRIIGFIIFVGDINGRSFVTFVIPSQLDFPQFERTGEAGRPEMMSVSMPHDGRLAELLPLAGGLSGGVGMCWRRSIEGSCAAGATRFYGCDDDTSLPRRCRSGAGATGTRNLVVRLPRLLHGAGLEACSRPRRRGGAGPAQAHRQRGAAGDGARGQPGLRPLPRGAEPGALERTRKPSKSPPVSSEDSPRLSATPRNMRKVELRRRSGPRTSGLRSRCRGRPSPRWHGRRDSPGSPGCA